MSKLSDLQDLFEYIDRYVEAMRLAGKPVKQITISQYQYSVLNANVGFDAIRQTADGLTYKGMLIKKQGD